jgi:hypothetical protein
MTGVSDGVHSRGAAAGDGEEDVVAVHQLVHCPHRFGNEIFHVLGDETDLAAVDAAGFVGLVERHADGVGGVADRRPRRSPGDGRFTPRPNARQRPEPATREFPPGVAIGSGRALTLNNVPLLFDRDWKLVVGVILLALGGQIKCQGC